ncbi:MAG: NTP transferase domain-containing protein [Planctomycetaceae bacterium]|nr:NTP transferase domain-containing protein [Planctomycetales bacterium]MCB9927707.1 NTP transferase domain-containing protein [Planctomycetaceae bacterium]
MSHTLGVVEVPTFSYASMAHSLTTRKFGNKPLFEWVARRVTEAICIDQVLIVADPSFREVVERLLPPDVAAYFGAQHDPLSRLAAAIRKADATSIVRVRADRPFVDPSLIDRLICDAHAHPGCDYVGYMCRDGGSLLQSQLGIFAEWCSADAIFRSDRAAADSLDRQHSTRYVTSHPEHFQLRFLPTPIEIDRDDIRLAIDHEEDWEHAHVIYDALGPERLDWRRIAELLAAQPELRRKMASLNRACSTVD